MDNKHKPLRGAEKKKILVSDESLLLKLLQRVQKLKDKAESDRDESTLINKNHDYTFDKKKRRKKSCVQECGSELEQGQETSSHRQMLAQGHETV